MLTKKNPLRACLAGAALAAAALAGTAHAEGLYVGGALGKPDWHSPINGISGDAGGTGLKVYGGYWFSPQFGTELGYFDLGHADGVAGRARAKGGYADALGRFEFAPSWSLLGSAGLAYGRFDTPGGNDSSPALKLGVGLQYDLTKTVSLRAQYERYRFIDAFDTKANIGQTTLGVNVGF
jgi:OmpA-OmpF porin, OOP family